MGAFFVLLLIAAANVILVNGNEDAEHANTLHKCLIQVTGKIKLGDLKKISRYPEWTVEEIPCFSHCMAANSGYFDAVSGKWNKQYIVDELGADSYNYCRYELSREFAHVCEFAYKGFRCLKQAEQHLPRTYASLLGCADKLHATVEQLEKYAFFPEVEEVPCLFKCFADRMDFYTLDYGWNFDNWVKAFGPVRMENSDPGVCKASTAQVQQSDKCAWMYEEYNCLEKLLYNTHGTMQRMDVSTNTIRRVKREKYL